MLARWDFGGRAPRTTSDRQPLRVLHHSVLIAFVSARRAVLPFARSAQCSFRSVLVPLGARSAQCPSRWGPVPTRAALAIGVAELDGELRVEAPRGGSHV